MGALLILFLAGVYVWVGVRLLRSFSTLAGKLVTLLVLILIPSADGIYGRIKLKQMCEAQGGLKILRPVEGAKGFRDQHFRPEKEWITKYGYQFIEGRGPDGRPARVSRQADGTITTEHDVIPISEYASEEEAGDLGWGYRYGEYRIINIQTNEKLGVFKTFTYDGGWIERAIGHLYGSKGSANGCGYGDSWQITLKLIQETLQPAQE
ncbi:MAG: hypothetical protein ABI612_09100 [Betaproteobacteria bacterium]